MLILVLAMCLAAVAHRYLEPSRLLRSSPRSGENDQAPGSRGLLLLSAAFALAHSSPLTGRRTADRTGFTSSFCSGRAMPRRWLCRVELDPRLSCPDREIVAYVLAHDTVRLLAAHQLTARRAGQGSWSGRLPACLS